MALTIRQTPFQLPALADTLRDYYLSPAEFRRAICSFEGDDLAQFLRAYVMFGIPFAFQQRPLLWEAVRGWIGRRLDVRADHVHLLGSGRTGFSTSPDTFGRTFSETSDLDFSVIAPGLFADCERDCIRFAADVIANGIRPSNPTQASYWRSNCQFIRDNLPNGFLDPWKVPSLHDKYPICAKTNNEASILVDRLLKTGGPVAHKASFRVYANWQSFSDRVRTNYRAIRDRLR